MKNYNIMHSGGAIGSDTYWAIKATDLGHRVIHHSFEGHRKIDAPGEIDYIDKYSNLFPMIDSHLAAANEILDRSYPTRSHHTNMLLRRNFFQIWLSRSVYAVGFLDDDMSVKGGTAWAIEMFKNIRGGNIFFFEQNHQRWFTKMKNQRTFVEAPKCFVPLKPYGWWTGIGTRNLLDVGMKAIDEVLAPDKT